MAALLLCSAVSAQTWKTQIEKVSGNQKIKTIRLKPSMQVTIQSLILENDTLRESRVFYGDFAGGTADSMSIRLKSTTLQRIYTNGIRHTLVTPARYYIPAKRPDTNMMKVALSDIKSLDFKHEKWTNAGEIAEPVLLLSLFTMVISPLICYNFRDNKFNADRYKYWALGSTAGVATGFATIFVTNAIPPHGHYQFKEGWPQKKAKVWKFKLQ